MQYYHLYLENLRRRYQANEMIMSLEKKFQKELEDYIFEQEKGKPLLEFGEVYMLAGVKADIYTSCNELDIYNIDAVLTYFTTAKLPKYKRVALERMKEAYERKEWLGHQSYKVPLYIHTYYPYDLKRILKMLQEKKS